MVLLQAVLPRLVAMIVQEPKNLLNLGQQKQLFPLYACFYMLWNCGVRVVPVQSTCGTFTQVSILGTFVELDASI